MYFKLDGTTKDLNAVEYGEVIVKCNQINTFDLQNRIHRQGEFLSGNKE